MCLSPFLLKGDEDEANAERFVIFFPYSQSTGAECLQQTALKEKYRPSLDSYMSVFIFSPCAEEIKGAVKLKPHNASQKGRVFVSF